MKKHHNVEQEGDQVQDVVTSLYQQNKRDSSASTINVKSAAATCNFLTPRIYFTDDPLGKLSLLRRCMHAIFIIRSS